MKRVMWLIVVVACAMCTGRTCGEELFAKSVGQVQVGAVTQISPLSVPFITWGGDMATFYANGGLKTQPGTIFAELGLNLQLEPGDDFIQQVRNYTEGRTPFLRGTFRMIGMASEVIGSDPRTRGVVFMQLTWSEGDHMVGRNTIPDAGDLKDRLKNKKIVLQAGGPHVGLLDDILKDARLSWEDIRVVWAKDLTGTPNSPAQMFRADDSIDACFVITPDMIGLCGGIDKEGTGAEGTVKGARVKVSTQKLSHSIADVYVCREDFFEANKDMVTKFMAGYLKACEEVVKLRDDFDAKRISDADKQRYMALLQLSQDIYGKEAMPTLEEDAHGLLMDANFVGYPGNWKFFKWAGNTVGFEEFNNKSLKLATSRGYAKARIELLASKIDFDSGAFASLADRSKPPPPIVTAGGKAIKTEVTDKDFEDIPFEFSIYFEPDQIDFSERQYGDDFARVVDVAAKWGACTVLIRGHADPTKAINTMIEAGIELGILKREGGAYYLKGRPLSIESTGEIVKLIESGVFEGAAKAGSPKEIVGAAKQLSSKRTENVATSILKYAEVHGLVLDPSQLAVQGVGIADPAIPKPRNMEEARKNMRVVFKIGKLRAEARSESEFKKY